MKRFLSFALKAVVSVALFYIAARSVNLRMLLTRLASIDLTWAALALMLMAGQLAFTSTRWQRIAALASAQLSLREALLFTVIGTFFNQTLPSTVGGDAARVWLAARSNGNWKGTTYSVLIDRAVGLVWLAVIVLTSLPWSFVPINNAVARITLVIIGVGGIAGPAALYLMTKLLHASLVRWAFTRHVTDIACLLWKTLTSRATGPAVGGLSVCVHGITITAIWLMARAIGAPFQLFDALLLVPPVVLIAAIPISIAGWGLREGAMVAAFAYAGLPDSDGLAVSVLYGLGLFLIGGIGGITWIISGRTIRLATDNPSAL